MIGKAKSCIGGTALANYVMKDVKGYELLRNNLSGMTPTQILQEMKIIQNLNQKAQYKTLSLVLSPEKTEGQKLTNKELQEMTLDFLKEHKIDVKNQQYLAFVHTEKEHKHIHIICNRVKDDGTLVTDSYALQASLDTRLKFCLYHNIKFKKLRNRFYTVSNKYQSLAKEMLCKIPCLNCKIY